MRIRLATLLGVLLSPTLALSQTHCLKGEIDYFSCQTSSNGKVISICGNILHGEISDDSWLQYRFGQIGKIEITYPTEKSGSISKFEGIYFNRYGIVSLRFINGKTMYDVGLAQKYEGEDAQERKQPFGGVGVALNKTKHLNISCQKVDIERYFGALTQLATSLEQYNGKTDFLYRFYNPVSK